MSTSTILITGGAGFIGSHLADELLQQGYQVRVLDSLHPQIHPDQMAPDYLNPEVELLVGDVQDRAILTRALQGVDAVYHFAACVGVGQSMYEIDRYTETNVVGTARLLQVLRDQPVRKLVVASSMSVYGEGLYRTQDGHVVSPNHRDEAATRAGIWEFHDEDGRPLAALPTDETKPCHPTSIYALGKYDQERMCLIAGDAYQFPVVALRFFNVYGPRQALSNPYTGVLAIFASRLLNGHPPQIFEDGQQRRDFVHVRDVAHACRLALEKEGANGLAVNVGSGQPRTIEQVAQALGRATGRESVGYDITGRFRVGDIRHCYADIQRAQSSLGYEPQVRFEVGLEELAEWLIEQEADDRFDGAQAELASRGLTR